MGIARKQKVRVEDPLWKKQMREALKVGDGNMFAEGLREWERCMRVLAAERDFERLTWYPYTENTGK